MRTVFSFIFFLCTFSELIDAAQTLPFKKHQTLSFEVRQHDYMFSTILNITSDHSHLGSIVKSPFRIRTSYELLNPKNEYEGVGICRFLTLGGGTWEAQIDVYDAKKIKIGEIRGEVIPNRPIQFFLYNDENICLGIACLDSLKSKFTIVHPENDQQRLVVLKRNYVRGIVDYWNVTINVIDAIDLRLIKIFAAFAIDSQDEFREN